MQSFIKITFLLILFTYSNISRAQFENYYKGYFRLPLDIPPLLSANFGELRTDHFHSGIDFKTQGTIGKNIYACADGYISRIKITSASYGKTLYITHPNGLITVYAHLNNFNLQLENYTREKQYEKQSYEIDIFPEPNEIPVLKSDIIGLSGNSGYSFGPHLHFEIRDARNNDPINPLLFDFNIADNVQPKIFSLIAYPQNNIGVIENSFQKQRFLAIRNNGNYKLTDIDTLEAFGPIGFAIEANDYLNNTHNKCGIYKSTLFVDGQKYFSHKIDKFSFAETRYINSHMDYELNLDKKKKTHKSFIEPNNKLSIYDYIYKNGIVNFSDSLIHEIKYIIEDTHGNISTLFFHVKSNPHLINLKNEIAYTSLFRYETMNVFDTGQIRIEIPAYALYDSLLFNFSIDSNSKFLTPIYHIHNMFTPIHKYFDITFKIDTATINLPKDKLLVCSFDTKNKVIPIGGEFFDTTLETKTRYFGPYFVSIDTIKPEIIPETFIEGKDLSHREEISFIIKDDLSGIKSYNGYIDDIWVLFEYDSKNDRITYYFDEKMQNEKSHKIFIIVEDERGNIAEFEGEFLWTKIG